MSDNDNSVGKIHLDLEINDKTSDGIDKAQKQLEGTCQKASDQISNSFSKAQKRIKDILGKTFEEAQKEINDFEIKSDTFEDLQNKCKTLEDKVKDYSEKCTQAVLDEINDGTSGASQKIEELLKMLESKLKEVQSMKDEIISNAEASLPTKSPNLNDTPNNNSPPDTSGIEEVKEKTEEAIKVNSEFEESVKRFTQPYEQAESAVDRLNQKLEVQYSKLAHDQQAVENIAKKYAELDSADLGSEAAQKLEQALYKAESQVLRDKDAIDKLNSQISKMSDDAVSSLEKVSDELDDVSSKASSIGNAVKSNLSSAFTKAKNAGNSAISKLRLGLNAAGKSGEEASKKISSGFKSANKAVNNTSGIVSKFGKNIKRVFKAVFITAAIYTAFRGLKSLFTDAMEQSTEFQKALNNLKANFKIAFQPIIDYVLPILTKLVNGLAQVMAAVASFISGVFGTTYEKSKEAAKAASETAKKSSEEAKKYLNSYDVMNVAEDTSSDSDSSEDEGIDWDSVSTQGNKTAESLGAKFKSILSGLAAPLTDGFKSAISSIQKGIDSVNWGNIKDNCKSIFNDLKPIASAAFDGVTKIANSALKTVGSVVGGIISVAGKSLETGTKGIADWLKKDKTKIADFIKQSSKSISKGFDNLTSFSDSMFSTIGESIDRVRPQVSGAITNMLSGFTDFGIGIGTVLSEGFEIATGSVAEWAEENKDTIGEFFDNIQLMAADVMNLFGDIFGDIGTIISDWWNGEDGGATIFKNVCDMFTDIGTTLMNVFNEWIKPVWDFIVDVVKKAWDNCLKPVFDKLLSLIGKVADLISALWDNILSPIVNWVVDTLKPIITTVFDAIGEVFGTVFGIIGDVLGGVMDALGGLIDFITGVFTGDWEKAWTGIKDFVGGIWDAIWGLIKGVINLIIDAVNTIWSLLYSVFSTIVNIIGGIAGFIGDIFGCDWSFSMPEDPPLIPKLAKGGLVSAPTLAMVGDNPNASSDPEVVAPLSKLEKIMGSGSSEDQKKIISLLEEIIELLKALDFTFNGQIDGKTLFEFIVDFNRKNTKNTGVNALV